MRQRLVRRRALLHAGAIGMESGMSASEETVSADDVFKRIADIVRDVLDEPELELAPETTARDVNGWDSIAMINIILDVQKAFGVRFRSAEVDKLSSVGDFAALTRRKIEELGVGASP